MVPTEVLARQHYEALTKLLEENRAAGGNIVPCFLTGSNTVRRKTADLRKQIASGERARMIVGTHALIQEKVEYESLALVITDEQHRFGVRQREECSSTKDNKPECSGHECDTDSHERWGLSLYGDLDISIIDELPCPPTAHQEIVWWTPVTGPKAYRFHRKTGAGKVRQVYVILSHGGRE
ncbi:MAG: DEAD/DEAH box helicase [Lachnospiraceae bacterium]